MPRLKAIQTIYNGYRFRSRLEARWAVFMDTLQIKYDYEPEGFNLDGTHYLPDFWLPTQECWLEIKATPPTESEQTRAGLLAEHADKMVYVLWGQMSSPSSYADGADCHWAFFPDGSIDFQYWWCECGKCEAIDLEYAGRSSRMDCRCRSIFKRKEQNYDSFNLRHAYSAARKARFEHGESP